MAIDKGSMTVEATQEERSWRVEVFRDEGSDYRIKFHRETLTKSPGGAVLARVAAPPVERTYSQITGQKDALQALDLLRVLGDRWAVEDTCPVVPKGVANAAVNLPKQPTNVEPLKVQPPPPKKTFWQKIAAFFRG